MAKKQTGAVRLSDILDPTLLFPGASSQKVSVTFKNVRRWEAEAEALSSALKDATILDAIRYVEEHAPSAGVVALLFFVARDKIKSEQGRKNALARLKKDPRQQEKKLVFECWQEWRKKPDNYESKAAFARDMREKVEHLKSQKKIEDWCREWEAKYGTQRA
ncbi:MAG: hypothetical protein HY017_33165 [Betaproteobacteria bacterium]|nr:hypothetical protein [Betaproteobacteria bacterium]